MVTYLHDHYGESNESVREIHTRMPVILSERCHEIGHTVKSERILHPNPAHRMKAWRTMRGNLVLKE
jgi:putative SOS response-associated peptidase YedK